MADRTPRRLAASIVVGLLAIPLAAVASGSLVGSFVSQPEPSEAPTTVADGQQDVMRSAESTASLRDDLEVACGEAGLVLVDAESTGTITIVQQAALDALRPICDAEGMPLPPGPEPEPITRTITVRAPDVAATTGLISSREGEEYREHEDDEHGYEHEDDEYEHEDDD